MSLNPTQQLAGLLIGDADWINPTMAVAAVGCLLALWLNRRRLASMGLATSLRITAWLILAACLLNPLWSSSRPRSGANVLAVVADISRSHLVTADSPNTTRADQLIKLLESGERTEPNGWLNRIGQDFELRRYVIGERLKQVEQYGRPEFDGVASSLKTGLEQLKQRYEGQPLAGIILLSDGNATDATGTLEDLKGIAPVYPVLLTDDVSRSDVSVRQVAINQTAFDDAPVTLQIQPHVDRSNGRQIKVTLRNADGVPIKSETQAAGSDIPIRFQHRPVGGGTVFYQVQAELLDASGNPVTDEITTVNNQRLIAVDRGSQPRRVLYLSGRPNWEFKFLQRAVETDPLISMVGLIRIARKEAKFDFRGRDGERSNSLFRGFEQSEQEVAEEYDEPVLVKINTRKGELETGFPQTAEELFQYDAIILDDVESGFFLADQMKLIYDFVARRGGGLMMMAGQESFRQGDYDRTPIGEMLPVDLSRAMPNPTEEVRLSLTREGWLQPWVRIRSDETAENERIDAMPGFLTMNTSAFVRPGAVVMAEVEDSQKQRWPALVVQRFGKGRTAALCIGDLWRWRLREGLDILHGNRPASGKTVGTLAPYADGPSDPGSPGSSASDDLSDHARACRQMIRWLVADVPRRLDVSTTPEPAVGVGAMRISAVVKGLDFNAQENADVRFKVTGPDGKKLELTGEPAEGKSGVFEAVVASSQAGPWTVEVTAEVIGNAVSAAGQTPVAGSPDKPKQKPAEPLTASTGWASQPDQDEMKSVTINRGFLDEVSRISGGAVVAMADLESFVDGLPQSSAPLVEVWSWPVWHQWWIFLTAMVCLVGDWTLRRRRGLP